MNRKTIIVIGIMLFCSTSMLAQTPSGYLGKRMMVSYNFVSFPRFYPLLYEQELEFRYKHTIELEYITQRKKALGIAFSYQDFSTVLTEYPFDEFGKNNAFPKNQSPVDASTTLENKSIYVGVSYKVFHNNIAPLGTFSRFGVDQITSFVALKNVATSQDSILYIPTLSTDDQYFAIMFSYSIGTQRVLWDKVLVRFAVKSGYVFGGLKQTRIGITNGFFEDLEFDIFDEIFDTGTDKLNYTQNVTKNSLLNHNIISVTLGIGFLVY